MVRARAGQAAEAALTALPSPSASILSSAHLPEVGRRAAATPATRRPPCRTRLCQVPRQPAAGRPRTGCTCIRQAATRVRLPHVRASRLLAKRAWCRRCRCSRSRLLFSLLVSSSLFSSLPSLPACERAKDRGGQGRRGGRVAKETTDCHGALLCTDAQPRRVGSPRLPPLACAPARRSRLAATWAGGGGSLEARKGGDDGAWVAVLGGVSARP